MIITAGIECDFSGAARFRNRAYYVERLISVEWRNLDSNQLFDFRQLAPETVRERESAHAGL